MASRRFKLRGTLVPLGQVFLTEILVLETIPHPCNPLVFWKPYTESLESYGEACVVYVMNAKMLRVCA